MIRKIVAVDTNVLLDYLFKREPGYKKALKLMKDCQSKEIEIFIPNIVFSELVWVVKSFYKQSRSFISDFLEELLDLEGILIKDRFVLMNGLNFFKQTNLKFTDAMILAQVEDYQPDEFITFDEDLKKIYQKFGS